MLLIQINLLIRRIFRHPLTFAIKTGGLSVGICSTLFLMVYLINELQYDTSLQNSRRIYRAITYDVQKESKSALSALPLGTVLKHNFPDVRDMCRFSQPFEAEYRSSSLGNFKTEIIYADTNTVRFLELEMLGKTRNKYLADKSAILISDQMAIKAFGNTDVSGKQIEFNILGRKYTFFIEGVFETLQNSSLDLQILGSMNVYLQSSDDTRYNPMKTSSWGARYFSTYLLLRDGVQIQEFSNKVNQYLNQAYEVEYEIHFQPLEDIYLQSSNLNTNYTKQGNIRNISFLLIIGIFILVSSSINFLILSGTANLSRFKELGVRKIHGATRKEIFTIIWIEAIFSIIFSLLLSIMLFFLFESYIDRQFMEALYIYDHLIPLYLLGILVLVTVLSLISGLFILLFTFNSNPLDFLMKRGGGRNSGFSMNQFFLFLQTCIFLFLVFASLIINRQWNFLNREGLGYDPVNLLVIPLDPAMQKHKDAILAELSQVLGIEKITHADNLPLLGPFMDHAVFDPENSKMISLEKLSVGSKFFETFQIPVIQGRAFFGGRMENNESTLMLNESAVKFLELKNPLKEKLNLKNVIGVVGDFHMRSIYEEIKPLIILYDANNASYLVLKLSSVRQAVLSKIESKLKAFNAAYVPDFKLLEEIHKHHHAGEYKLRNIIMLFAIIIYIIGMSGYIGLMNQYALRKRKEMGIRKIFGASTTGLMLIIIRRLALIILIAFIFSLPLAWYIMHDWLNNYPVHISIRLFDIIFPLLLAVMANILLVSAGIFRIAGQSIMNIIRYE